MNAMILNVIKTIAILSTSIIAIITLIKGYSEYKLLNKMKRVELYNQYIHEFNNGEIINKIIILLENNSKDIINIPRIQKYLFIGFLKILLY